MIEGKNFVDDRGMLTFFNDFDFSDIKRMYLVRNHNAGFIRAWHGHKRESKYITVIKGAAIVAATPMSIHDDSFRVTLSEYDPKILIVPPNYYNGFKTLTDDTIIQFFSTKTLEESQEDDYREPYDYFPTSIFEERYR